jgi:hypothetical protein
MAQRKQSDFYTGVRTRGFLNATLDEIALRFQADHPEQRVKWEHSPVSGDSSMVTMREAQGLRVVDATELKETTDSSQKAGPIRRGDLIMMAGPKEVLDALDAADAEAADQDYKLPETTYKEYLEKQQYRLSSGETKPGKGFGEIRRTYEETPVIPTGEGGETE